MALDAETTRKLADEVVLENGPYAARILPNLGSSLASLTWYGKDLVQCLPASPVPPYLHIQLGMFPMFPFAGRVANGSFAWKGKTYELPVHPGEEHSLHGAGWQAEWMVAEQNANRALFMLDASDYPLPCEARHDYRLTDKGLTVELGITNRAGVPLPFGLGHHPFFPRETGARVQFAARRFWMHWPDGIPTDSIALPPDLDFSSPKPMPQGFRNNCYEGWDRNLTIDYPISKMRVKMSASERLDWLMVYCNPHLQAVCFEPQTLLPSAHTTPGEGERYGLVELQPGETLSGSVTFSAQSL